MTANAWNRNQPIILYLRELLPERFPMLRNRRRRHRSGIGGWVPRTTASGGFSAHSEGRAADIFLEASDLPELEVGNALFKMFHLNGTALGVDHMIWNRKIWSRTNGGPRPYTGSNGPHTNHIHVAFTRRGSRQRPAQLPGLLDRELDGLSESTRILIRSWIAAGYQGRRH